MKRINKCVQMFSCCLSCESVANIFLKRFIFLVLHGKEVGTTDFKLSSTDFSYGTMSDGAAAPPPSVFGFRMQNLFVQNTNKIYVRLT